MGRKFKILLVEPDYRRNSRSIREQVKTENPPKQRGDESLWYPPIGLMKLARFHKDRGDEVHFVYGCEGKGEIFNATESWDRIYITTLYTYNWDKIIETINYYKELVWGDIEKIFVGGIIASLLHKDLAAKTGVNVIKGVLNSPKQIGLRGNRNIDLLPPDYSILDSRIYAINATYYAYTSRGCINSCSWCGVPIIEPTFVPYIDIKSMMKKLRKEYGDKPKLKLMDNNVMASRYLEKIVSDLIDLGYGKNSYTDSEPKKERVIDFNQGLDASFFTEDKMRIIAELNIKPMRIAFDRIEEKEEYVKAIEIAKKHGVKTFSNYMLYNFMDSPKDLYERLMVNIGLNEKWRKENRTGVSIYSYPMRYAPIKSTDSPTEISQENGICVPEKPKNEDSSDYNGIFWTRRFVRSIEIMKGVAHGSISPTPSLARRTLGKTYNEFLANLYMPEELLRNRNTYEKKIYKGEPKRKSGTGDVEKFRAFISGLLSKKDDRFMQFHNAVSKNSRGEIRKYIAKCKDRTMKKWLNFYIK
jgi:hypothetical protein